MAMQIEIDFDEDYREVCSYTGTINKKYKFSFDVLWLSKHRNYIVKNIDFDDDMSVNFDKEIAEKRIRKLTKEWYTLDE
tara:strand:+ start:121 stop:357 length:237 start_codon:yes stop_codon:yes gene_type:complete